ncbi:RNA-binding protein [Rhizocola hellebori]|uniref:RNA-binding protein n=1 Tax=Rhizocola hellebori TaxID=1392758 RepID=A0A8J3Q7S9_9ACTN|nr:TROVE domain-containing protein [Rhizocola hellebori]GIH05431.1 RNA-binding protein [Rhizocola hellebori]
MGKFNKIRVKAAALSPIVTGRRPAGRTHEGAPGYARDAKGELFLLAVSNMSGEDTFYEAASARDERYTRLVHEVATVDPQWMVAFLGWLRTGANMRSASLVGALEAAKAMLAANIAGSRQLVAAVLQRADEPGEALAYWVSRYGRAIPKPVKRGVADAVGRLYTEYGLLKYDTAARGFRFADVIDLAHPVPVAPWQSDLFKVALERRHRRDSFSTNALPMLVANAELRAAAANDAAALVDPQRLKAAGMTWEDVLSLAGSTVDKAQLWQALIPSMGYMALLRNLRGFDEAGVSDEVAAGVAARLADPVQVAKSRQFPFRFLAAHEQTPSLRWGHALDKALQASLANLPALPGRTLILVDTSASMTQRAMSARSKMTPAKAAAVFGVALAAKGERVDLYGFADGVFRHEVPKAASVLNEVKRFTARTGEVGHGTQIVASLRASFKQHDRVVIISDMQTMNGAHGKGVSDAVPAQVPIYGFNLGGYQHGAYATGAAHRHEFGGLTDATFRMLPLLEMGRNASWPWT